MDSQERVRALREAGQVMRCHTLPHHGTYTVGQHSYDMANLLLCLHPNPSFNLIKAALWHDSGERWTGDMPAPAKWALPDTRRRLKELEDGILTAIDCKVELTAQEEVWLNAIDKIELWIWSKDQVRMGNKNAYAPLQNLHDYFEKLRQMGTMPAECDAFLRLYNHERNDDGIPGQD